MTQRNTSRRAFTLIELLVVIAIISILAALLFPVFARAKDAAKRTVALAQMKQLAMSVMMYASDYDDTLVPSTNYDADTSDPHRIWTAPLFPYVKNKQIFVAPGSSTSKYSENWATRHWQSIGMNGITAYGTSVLNGGGLEPDELCTPGELKLGCEGFSSAVTFSSIDEPARSGLFATTPDGEPGTKYRGYVFGPDNGTMFRPDFVAFTDLSLAVPLASDRDLVKELGGSLSPGQLKPIYARYGQTGKDDGTTPVIFADGHARSYIVKTIADGTSGIIWRFR
ncbi:MAG TPA: type II secretion system protein [Fimbriimonadaceae bacterium]|nr:type II secretion system protein [Fimbriimonadaceae bacterium]